MPKKMVGSRWWAAGLLLLSGIGVVGIWRGLPERWCAISSRGGEALRLAPLSTPYYLQKDPRWQNETIGGSGEPLARVGCAVCSLAMALDLYGIKTNPKELNDFLKSNGGYNERGWLKWNSATKFADGKVSFEYIGSPDYKRIDRALQNHRPVIAKILINQTIPHWILIVGKERVEYLMRDPMGDGDNVRPVSFYGSKIYAIRILKAVP